MEAKGRFFGRGNGFDYWLFGDQLYRCRQDSEASKQDHGMPGDVRWECSVEHYNRYKAVLGIVEPAPEQDDDELWDADPTCKHEIECAPGGGVKCTKCSGWYCL